MTESNNCKPIRTADDLSSALIQLLDIDPELKVHANAIGPLPLRLYEPGFPALARIITAQLVSQASASAIYGRLEEIVPSLSPQSWLATQDELRQHIGLTRAKQHSLDLVAEAIMNNDLDLARLPDLPAEKAMRQLTQFKGIGRWTAEIYLLFCCGHPDIFPSGDLALRVAVAKAYDLGDKPPEKQIREFAERWKPYRGIAARLFWAYYRETLGRGETLA